MTSMSNEPKRYRKKPVEIEAMLYRETDVFKIRDWFLENGALMRLEIGALGESLVIPTLEGDMRALPGDWIIKGIKGEFYPCKDDIFKASYEPA